MEDSKMAKSSIQVLARYISEKRGVPQRDAEHFVKSFFEIISETLQSGESLVKIKGFGTFKIVDVKDRESVDVNTGERIVIEGRSKISFIPDNVMKELVNKPFSQFETVVVNDGVNFEEEVKEEGVQGVMGVQEVQGVPGV
jgi:nucleoid DNA-binding protein